MLASSWRSWVGVPVLWLLDFSALALFTPFLTHPLGPWLWPSLALVALFQTLCAFTLLPLSKKLLGWKKRRAPRISDDVKAERVRIAQNLHDTVGAYLFQAMELLKAPIINAACVRDSLENALWSLRVELGVLDDTGASLVDRLATMRSRLQPLLDVRGIQMDWHMPVLEAEQRPRGKQGLQLAMLAQEAIHNALRHAHCNVVQVQLTLTKGVWCLRIADDGCGYLTPPGKSHTGSHTDSSIHGMNTMAERARIAKAAMEIKSSPGRGTCITVTWQHWMPGT